MDDHLSSAQRHVTRDELDEAISNLARGMNLVVCAMVLELERQQLIAGDGFAATLEQVASVDRRGRFRSNIGAGRLTIRDKPRPACSRHAGEGDGAVCA